MSTAISSVAAEHSADGLVNRHAAADAYRGHRDGGIPSTRSSTWDAGSRASSSIMRRAGDAGPRLSGNASMLLMNGDARRDEPYGGRAYHAIRNFPSNIDPETGNLDWGAHAAIQAVSQLRLSAAIAADSRRYGHA